MAIQWDPRITLGNVIALIALIVTLAVGGLGLYRTVYATEGGLADVQKDIEKAIGDVRKEIDRLETNHDHFVTDRQYDAQHRALENRLNRMEEKIDRLLSRRPE